MHHPPFWIEPSTLTALRPTLTRISDLVLTGHEHFNDSYSQSHSSGEALAFYESPALYDSKHPQSSAFRVLIYDLSEGRQREVVFRWKEGIYRAMGADPLTSWKPLVINRASRHAFDLSPEHLNKLSDVGIAYIQSGLNPARLSDLFVYPDIRTEDANGKPANIRGLNVLNAIADSGTFLIQGGTFSGKTALSQALCLDLNTVLGKVPVLLEGSDLNDLDAADKFRREVIRALKQQYSDPDTDAFLQLPIDARAVIIDNWHLARLSQNQRDAIYSFLAIFAGCSVLMVDQLFRIRRMISSKTLVRPWLQAPDVEIAGLSHGFHGRLIDSWYRLRRPSYSDSPDEIFNAAKVSESEISKLLGHDNLPPYAFSLTVYRRRKVAKSRASREDLLVIIMRSSDNDPRSGSREKLLDRKFAFCSEAIHNLEQKEQKLYPAAIDIIVENYRNTHLVTLQADNMLADLEQARVLSLSEGHYRFTFDQFISTL